MSDALIDPPIIVSLAQISEFLNLSRTRVTQLCNEGVLPKGAPGRYDLEACGRAYIKFQQDNAGKRQVIGNANESRARLLAAKAASAEIELKIQQDEYAPVSEMLEVMTSAYGMVKERLLCMPGKLAVALVGREMREIEDRIREDIHEALAELSAPEFGRGKAAE